MHAEYSSEPTALARAVNSPCWRCGLGFNRAALALFVALLISGAAARAELLLPRPRADLGDVHAGPALVQRFPLVNDGSQPIEITAAKASCGCLKPRLSKQILEPGEQGWVEVEVNTLSQPVGPNAWRIDLKYRVGDRPAAAAVLITATLSKDISVEPAALTISTDQAIAHEICVTDLRARPLTVTVVRASSPHLHVTLQPPCRDGQGHAVRVVKLEVAADYPEGRHDEVVSLFTDDPAYAELKVNATITKRARQRISATPAEVTLSAPAGQPLPSRIVLIRDSQNEKVVIDKVTADNPGIVCRWAEGPDHMATVKVQVDPERLSTSSGVVSVHLTQPTDQTVIIPVSVVRLPRPPANCQNP
jgi:hypothetical protein